MQKRQSLKIILIVFTIVIIIGYAYYQSRALISGPEIIILSPQNGKSFDDSLVKIKGGTKNITHLSLNDKTIFVDRTGAFSEKLLIYKGLNIIEIEASDKFGRTINKTLKLVLK